MNIDQGAADNLGDGSSHKSIEDLQARVAFQEDAITALSNQIAKQDAELHTLRTQLIAVNKKLNELAYDANGAAAPTQEVPPHY